MYSVINDCSRAVLAYPLVKALSDGCFPSRIRLLNEGHLIDERFIDSDRTLLVLIANYQNSVIDVKNSKTSSPGILTRTDCRCNAM